MKKQAIPSRFVRPQVEALERRESPVDLAGAFSASLPLSLRQSGDFHLPVAAHASNAEKKEGG